MVIFLPAFGAIVLCLAPRASDQAFKRFSLFITVVTFVLTLWLAAPMGKVGNFAIGMSGMQNTVNHAWIPAFGIEYLLGVDGISMPLVVLTTFLSMLAAAASWPITKHV
ncbi:MAG: NADH-quinone oxidoreductase subunit M, partial [Thermoguttaceae bacterium]